MNRLILIKLELAIIFTVALLAHELIADFGFGLRELVNLVSEVRGMN